MSVRERITEGKTKIIWPGDTEDTVLIQSKDDITAGDGARRDILEGKGELSTETTCNCFSLLKAKGIPTHFIRRVDGETFLAERIRMIPIESVVRRIATGSYLKRHPDVSEGTLFNPLVFEAFYKADDFHDPLLIWDATSKKFELYNAWKPLAPRAYLFDLAPNKIPKPDGHPFDEMDLLELHKITKDVFLVLESAWKVLDVVLVDLKIECGWTQSGALVVADVIDPDSCRIWPGGKKENMKDKQVYRDLNCVTAEAMKKIRENYAWVAKVTGNFVR